MPETVIWTALPNGLVVDGGGRRLRLSVLVSPRLTTPDGAVGRLAQFPDLRNWPSTIGAAMFDVEVDGDVVVDGVRPQNGLQPRLWAGLFTDDTLVRSHRFKDPEDRPLVSYEVRPLLQSLAQLYGSAAIDARNNLPPNFFGEAKERTLNDLLAASEFRPDPEDVAGEKPVTRFRQFHTRPERPDAPLPQTPAELADLLDFHQAVSSLGDYPQLMRSLALVFDLEVPADAIVASGDLRRLRVIPRWEPTDPESPAPDRSPTTRAVWDGTAFAAAAAGAPIRDGLLDLDPADFDLVQVDVDGAALKLVDLALNLAHMRFASAPDTPPRGGLPALQTAGLSLVQLNRAASVRQRLAGAKSQNAAVDAGNPEDAVLGAGDLVRGFCIDVWDSRTQTWHSLCRRIGSYEFQSIGVTEEIEDDGFVQLSAAGVPQAPDKPPQNQLYLHEAILRWEGWSLAAIRPGRALDRQSEPGLETSRPSNAPLTQFKLKTSFTPPKGSLPALRFGRHYRMRARVVDLAGNDVLLADAGEEQSLPRRSPGQAHLRYEPVPPPIVVLRQKLTARDAPGESLERLVVRSANIDPSLDAAPTSGVAERHVAPPRTTAAMAESHGMYDDPNGRLRGDGATHAMISTRDGAQLPQDDETPVFGGPQLTVPYLPDPFARGAALRDLPGARSGTVGRVGASEEIPYEPPPVVVRPGSVTMVDFGTPERWPSMLPFRLVLADGTSPPTWDAGARVLTVRLPKGETTVVALSSYLDRADLELMGVWDWLHREVDARVSATTNRFELQQLAAAVAEATQRAIEGGHWMLTPARELVLVHAVQQPLGVPVVEELVATRLVARTEAAFLGSLRVHGKSTSKVELLATWDEFTDIGPEPDRPVLVESQLAELPLRALQKSAAPEPVIFYGNDIVGRYQRDGDRIELTANSRPIHAFADTRHRKLRCRAVASSRFAEYFRRQETVRLSGTAPVVLAAGGVARGSETVRSQDGTTTFNRVEDGAGDYTVDYGAGTLARTGTSTIANGAAVHVDFLPPVSRRSPDEVTVHVPSSSRPAAPDVLYVVPLFEWKRQTRTNLLASERRGGWLRVYLGRPWHSSGEGELLAVLRAAVNPSSPSVDVEPYVTSWGNDPVRGGNPITELLFLGTAAIDEGPRPTSGDTIGLSLAELPATTVENRVDAFAYNVEYDPDRGLWYSDISMSTVPDGGQPFVRLALARYQPHSVEQFDPDRPEDARDVKLSRVVRADFAQLSADRSLVATYDPQDPTVVKLVVCGRTYEDTADGGGPSDVVVEVEERRPGGEGDLAWLPAQRVTVARDSVEPEERDELLWRGAMQLPADAFIEDYRVVVKELDTLTADDPEQPGRLLYADAVELESLAPPRAPTTLSLTSSANPSAVGQSVTFTATVSTERAGAPSGSVTFRDGAVELGTTPLRNGVASLSTAGLSGGPHDITAVYTGDGDFKPSRASLRQMVMRSETKVDVVPRLEIHGKTPF